MFEQTLDESAWSSSDEDEANENKLPIDKHKYKILDHIDKYRVTCIHGETGSGKSTRVPQYIVQQYLQAESWGVDTLEKPNIIVTQPRRIAAKSLAKRVAHELGEKDVGGMVGYKIGQDQKAGENTMICFVTSGYFIELLVHNAENFDKFTHIILDEIHERNLDADLLSLMIKLLMKRHTKPKLIIMSATLHAQLFLRYFCDQDMFTMTDNLLFVGVDSPFNVTTLYVEDVYEYCEENNLPLTLNAKKQLVRTYTSFSEVSLSKLRAEEDYDVDDLDAFHKMQNLVLKYDISEKGNQRNTNKVPKGKDVPTIDKYVQTGVDIVQATAEPQGSILIFLPGIREIDVMYDLLMPHEDKQFDGWKCKLTIFPLHSKMPHEDQQECFREPAEDCCHVILATNIAESSITLPRVNVIIDFGQRRHVTYDPKKRLSYLKLNWCSQASMNQRKGRTGRVCDGVCFRMMTKEHFEKKLIEFDEAQMRLAPLDKLILQVKYIGECIAPDDSPSGLLNKAVEPPEGESILTAVKNLADIGALSAENEEAEVTLLGKFCMDTPLDLTLCRLVFMGAMFKCPADALVMAAAIQCQDPFKQPSNKVLKNQEKFIRGQKNSFNSRRKYDKQSYSEPIMYRNVVKDWCERIDEEEQYWNEYELNKQGAKLKTKKFDQRNRNDLKFLRNKFGRENEIDAKRLKLLEGVVSDVGFSLLKWLPKNSSNRGNVQNLLNALPRNRKQYRSKYTDDTESKKWKTVEEEATEDHKLFCDDNFLLNMLLASAFVPKFLYGEVGYRGQISKSGKPLPDRMEKIKNNMVNANVHPMKSICIANPPDYIRRSGNGDAVKYMIKCISLEVNFDAERNHFGAKQRERKDKNRFEFNGKDQMFIEFNTTDLSERCLLLDTNWKVTDDVHSSIASTFQYTEGAHGKDRTVIYELTRKEDLKLAINQEYKIKIGLPENPYRINFQLMSSNGTPLKTDSKGCIASCNRWRNPVGFVCDTESRPHYGVVASITAGDRGTLCWVDGMSLFPLYKCNLFAVCAMLAFLPHQHKAKFKILTTDMTIAQVELFNYEVALTRQGKLTRALLKIMNMLRAEVSEVFSNKKHKEAKKIPDCRMREFFDMLMDEMEDGDTQSTEQPHNEARRSYSRLSQFEEVDGFYTEFHPWETLEPVPYLKPYNYHLLCDKDELFEYVKKRGHTKYGLVYADAS